ncbi:uncharacterized protein B0T23DRAFT_413652 [Neurospora hispaniola]|uniref:Uncharacterized protein n=1 Tax=Neurospora hispaniola TaxID=588809 RepID=A0AAJ0I6B2_9PEZI|nr:hypothetical protein B0T23DRAFT_413652 [Neurospora hispaniola]
MTLRESSNDSIYATMPSGSHSRSHELDGDFAWRTGDKPELHGGNILEAAAATIPAKELPTQSSEPKELDSNVEPVELPAEVHDGGRTTRNLSEDGHGSGKEAKAQLKSALLSCKLTAVELIVELVELIACLHEAHPYKNTETWRFVTCQTLPESSFKADFSAHEQIQDEGQYGGPSLVGHSKASIPSQEVEIRFGAAVSTFKPHKATNGRTSRATWEKAMMGKSHVIEKRHVMEDLAEPSVSLELRLTPDGVLGTGQRERVWGLGGGAGDIVIPLPRKARRARCCLAIALQHHGDNDLRFADKPGWIGVPSCLCSARVSGPVNKVSDSNMRGEGLSL